MVGKAKCTLPGRLDGKLAVVTGANSGIGLETTAELARRGAYVIMACRSQERAESAKAEILQFYGEGEATALTRNVAAASVTQFLKPIQPEQAGLFPFHFIIEAFFSSSESSCWISRLSRLFERLQSASARRTRKLIYSSTMPG